MSMSEECRTSFAGNSCARAGVYLLAVAFLVSGCATAPAPPLSEHHLSLVTDGPQKASVTIYRTFGGWYDHALPAAIHIDDYFLMGMQVNEYVKIYLPPGKHEVLAQIYDGERYRPPTDWIALDLEPGDSYYIQVATSGGGVRFDRSFMMGMHPSLDVKLGVQPTSRVEAQSRMGDIEVDKEAMMHDDWIKERWRLELNLNAYSDLYK